MEVESRKKKSYEMSHIKSSSAINTFLHYKFLYPILCILPEFIQIIIDRAAWYAGPISFRNVC